MAQLSEMHLVIRNELQRIEQEEQVRILFACEAGSRAWGVPSKDSDYDVRFLYLRPVDSYLSLFEPRDVIERPISNQLDIHGWDLKKALLLFRKSNPPLLEWLQSPIQYYEKYSVARQIRDLSPLSFSPRSCMYHYLHMAKRNYRDCLSGEEVKIKKYLNVLRPLLACGWIVKYDKMPPMVFEIMVEDLMPAGSELKEVVLRLLDHKKSGAGLENESWLHRINEYTEQRIAYFEQAATGLKTADIHLDDRLDQLFRSALQEVWA
ncbi:nucleotidyltransferase domain-containing protein [Fontibacillus sp. BL9]|uniref:nucleotidyltransferase domain-containing protein n=1 Tax=Fontibacillus sp. BL9 TaxID=3389971 RepID=UPI0039787967